jgi:hypothetical protein
MSFIVAVFGIKGDNKKGVNKHRDKTHKMSL